MRTFELRPLLTAGEETELARRIHGDDMEDALAARNELVLSNLRLVAMAATACARRFRADYDELFAEGAVTLVRAAEGYDPVIHQTRFSTYALPAIRNELRDYVRLNRTVHVPLYLQQPGALARARAKVADWPKERDNLERNVQYAAAAILPFASLSPPDPGDSALEVADAELSPLEVLIQHETAERITIALEGLRPLRAYVIAHRLGLCGVEVRTLYSLARELGLSKQRLYQIDHAARADLARLLAADERACA